MTSSPPPPPPARRRFRLGLGAAVVLAIVALSTAVGLGLMQGQPSSVEAVPLAESSASVEPAPGEIYVHVLGAVVRPGLYVLRTDSRVVDALAAAGGSTDAADLAGVNLARRVEDGEQILVPVVGAVTDPSAAPPGDGTVDLNTADQAALEELPGIGPALAERIVAWREDNGRFRTVDDLLAVPGIGEKVLEGLRDAVRV
ncbi:MULTISPECIES: ComEA family DNA-binding protein [unclassified Microbacterium]|uniref:ComEA family DNA-binding protein n=1 Tax=unclassified Microbacterium TaxID=2609290 RepID=UPI0008F4B492|nr:MULTISPECIES: ComEA family DNA-binding protein [unclassified Microbacterium]OIJ32133.1 competence protein ComEA [Microbacterium sp. LCT-H2]